jgi:hypothetical protein
VCEREKEEKEEEYLFFADWLSALLLAPHHDDITQHTDKGGETAYEREGNSLPSPSPSPSSSIPSSSFSKADPEISPSSSSPFPSSSSTASSSSTPLQSESIHSYVRVHEQLMDLTKWEEDEEE